MSREYSALPLSPLAAAARLPDAELLERVTLDDPAFSVLTDLTQVTARHHRPGAKHRPRARDDARARACACSSCWTAIVSWSA